MRPWILGIVAFACLGAAPTESRASSPCCMSCVYGVYMYPRQFLPFWQRGPVRRLASGIWRLGGGWARSPFGQELIGMGRDFARREARDFFGDDGGDGGNGGGGGPVIGGAAGARSSSVAASQLRQVNLQQRILDLQFIEAAGAAPLNAAAIVTDSEKDAARDRLILELLNRVQLLEQRRR